MSADMVRVLNTHNGQTGPLPRRFFENPLYNKYLVEVTDNLKPYVPELFVPQTPEQFEDNHPTKVKGKKTSEETPPWVEESDTTEKEA